jgi:two-component system OmpR family response regulator
VDNVSKILLIEDDPVLGRSLLIKLELEGYQVNWSTTLGEAQKKLCENFDLLLVDVSLPDGSGIDFLRKSREQLKNTPVFVLTARTDEDTAVESLSIGATDFIRKPFGQRELLTRIKKSLDEPLNYEPQIRVADVTILSGQRRILHNESELDLNRREYDIFLFLAQNLDRVVTREALITMMGSSEIVDRTVDSHISHIRTKMKDKQIETVRIASVYGVGYRMEKS